MWREPPEVPGRVVCVRAVLPRAAEPCGDAARLRARVVEQAQELALGVQGQLVDLGQSVGGGGGVYQIIGVPFTTPSIL